jgi:hypothetical protein
MRVLSILLLVEEHYGVRPPYGVLVLAIAADIRQHRQRLDVVLPPPANPRQCLGCGQRGHCAVRRA